MALFPVPSPLYKLARDVFLRAYFERPKIQFCLLTNKVSLLGITVS